MYVFDIQHFTHELYDRLSLVESCCRNCKDKSISIIHLYFQFHRLCNNINSCGLFFYQHHLQQTWISIAVYQWHICIQDYLRFVRQVICVMIGYIVYCISLSYLNKRSFSIIRICFFIYIGFIFVLFYHVNVEWVSEWLLLNANSAIFSYIMTRTS